VVFAHGNPGPAGDWRDLLTRADELGRAGKPKDFRYSVDGYGRHLAALLEQLGEDVRIVANSVSGRWSGLPSRCPVWS
jgi:pimeloyl-ACP methyl ester carboxylesterase